MPIYEFRCLNECCKGEVEVMQRYEDPPPPCPFCKSETKKKVSPSSFALKGEGWYRDGYQKKSS